MARKAVPAYDAGEKETVEHLTKLFEAAKFEIQREMDLGDRPRWDLVLTRQELGRYRRFVVEIALTRNARDLPEKFSGTIAYARSRKVQDVDEYWLVSNLSLPESPRIQTERYPNVRFFTIKELERMLNRLNPKPRGGGKAKTKIGKAIEADEKSILLAIEALKLQIEDKIAKLRDERPNDPDAIKKLDASITQFEEIHAELERIKAAVQQFKKNEVKEKEIVEIVHAFKDSIGKWWNKNHDTIYSSASNSAFFIGATGLLHTIGADSATALAIAGSLIGGETVAKVLKSLPRGLFTKHKD
ncbi:Uma2 family endonuclease [Bradyrhizobium sp. CCGUVB1N3]|uniref:Uma2 family endonuclease n=1 Tax=Bradyrhizobium sp. CCGUVB1N3 TaxID=2949629 RepID=UPI0020B322C4|nr:Uma2 family endonuclease [Bradyrhizobium sp. CCGUVB1N3]MCP3475043.1 Uma2 family endonuclease [Bradyrhizobium sp. CCGUVB1N3]